MMKRYKNLLIVGLALLSCGYFSAMSGLEINYILKGSIVLVPLQVLALLYVAYFWQSKKVRDV